MKITKIKTGKAIKISYEEGMDKKTLTSKEMAAPEFYAAFSEMAYEIKEKLAEELGLEDEMADEFRERHKLRIDTIAFTCDGDGVVDAYEVWGDHYIENTIWYTEVHLQFQFGSIHSPDAAALNILKEAEEYIGDKRAQTNLFEKPEDLKDWKVTKVE